MLIYQKWCRTASFLYKRTVTRNLTSLCTKKLLHSQYFAGGLNLVMCLWYSPSWNVLLKLRYVHFYRRHIREVPCSNIDPDKRYSFISSVTLSK
jgi:hypothetical protein